jgi:acetyltransferase-like isoleucine patch superfamily enzyme
MSYTDLHYKFKKVGKNVQIGKNVYFRYPDLVEIGDNVIIDDFSYFTTGLSIGNYVHIGPHCTCIGGRESKLIMKDFSGLSAACRIICGSDDYVYGLTNPNIPIQFRGKVKSGDIVIGRHAVLGTNTIVHPLVQILDGVATGSFTLVTRDLAPWSVYTGIPAKKIKDRDKTTILELEERFLNSIGYVCSSEEFAKNRF